jgi:hypothetical protein
VNNSHGGARKGAGKPRRNLQIDKETALLLSQMRREHEGDVTEEQIVKELRDLAFMVSNWQALSNHAEVFAPELVNNTAWIALKSSLEQRTDEVGVTAFIKSIGEQYRQQLEGSDEE